jgi:ATP-dependent helicase/nuclease subunit A
MTRARDVLYVAGVRLINVPPRSWYTLVADALLPPDVARDTEDELAEPYVWPQPPRSPLPPAESEREAPPPAPLIPAWLHERAPSPPPAPEPLRPSGALGEPDPPRANSEAARPNVEARLRGRLVHRLLETLPAVPAAERARFAERIAAPDGLAPDQLPPILAEAEAVLALPPLRRFFAPDARAEAEIVGRLAIGGKSYAVNGRIDRLARDAAGWHLLDFKTDRSVPADAAAIDPAQILQLALYRRLLSEMAPEAEITATLAYTAAAKVIPVPAALMEQALSRLAARANSVP